MFKSHAYGALPFKDFNKGNDLKVSDNSSLVIVKRSFFEIYRGMYFIGNLKQ
jgi:hypothetical protein